MCVNSRTRTPALDVLQVRFREIQPRIELHAQRPKHEPRGLVESVGGAVPKRNARLFEAGGFGRDQFDKGHRRRFSIVRR